MTQIDAGKSQHESWKDVDTRRGDVDTRRSITLEGVDTRYERHDDVDTRRLEKEDVDTRRRVLERVRYRSFEA